MKIIFVFPFVFIGMWVFISFIISKMGWSDLVEKFRLDDKPETKRIGIISASLNSASYSNALVLRYNQEGLCMRPVWAFRLFHPDIFIPWSEIKDVREKKILFISTVDLIIGEPFLAAFKIKKSVFKKFERAYNSSLENSSSSERRIEY